MTSPKRNLTILTLMTGKWHAFEAYLQSLLKMDCDPKKIEIVWVTNANPSFVQTLYDVVPLLEKKGFAARIEKDRSIRPFAYQNDQVPGRYAQYLMEKAALMNVAWHKVVTDDVIILEEDVVVSSHTIKHLQSAWKEHKTASIIGAAGFDYLFRSKKAELKLALLAMRLRNVTGVEDAQMKSHLTLQSITTPWGVRPVDVLGFQCAWIKKSNLPKKAIGKIVFSPFGKHQDEDIAGHDTVFCLNVVQNKGQILCDFDVRVFKFFPTGECV